MSYILIPDYLLQNKLMSNSDCFVMGVLISTAKKQKSDLAEISYKQINQQLPLISINTIKNSIAKLVKYNYIEIYKGAKKTSTNKYKVLQYFNNKTETKIHDDEMDEVQYLVDLIRSTYQCDITIHGINKLVYFATLYGLEELHNAVNICLDRYDKHEFFNKIGGVLYNRKNKI